MCCNLEIRKKIKLLVILLLVPIWLAQVYGYLTPLPILSDISGSFTMFLSGLVISLFSYWIKKTVIFPITFFVMGIFWIWLSISWKGVAIYDLMAGTFFIMIGLVTAVFVVASSYKKPNSD